MANPLSSNVKSDFIISRILFTGNRNIQKKYIRRPLHVPFPEDS